MSNVFAYLYEKIFTSFVSILYFIATAIPSLIKVVMHATVLFTDIKLHFICQQLHQIKKAIPSTKRERLK